MGQAKKPSRVLVVEDDPTFRSFWTRLFDDMGVHNYVILANSDEAIHHLDQGNFTLLISDVVMPHLNGYDIAKYACKNMPDIQIVLTTGYSTDLSRFDLKDCRFHLLHKPYCNIGEIKKLISHLLNGEDVFGDASEDSFSENEDYPLVTEWRL